MSTGGVRPRGAWGGGAASSSTGCEQDPLRLLELDGDPYDPEEEDPARSRALESSLWELQVSLPRLPSPPGPPCSHPAPREGR